MPKSVPCTRSSAPIVRPTRYEELPDWVPLEQAKSYLHLGRHAFNNRLKTGDIPYRKFGKMIRIPKMALRPPGVLS